MKTDEREVVARRDQGGVCARQLRADHHRVEARDEEEEDDRDEVLDADDLVVGAHPEVAPRALVLMRVESDAGWPIIRLSG